jgi:hypothetical protein
MYLLTDRFSRVCNIGVIVGAYSVKTPAAKEVAVGDDGK